MNKIFARLYSIPIHKYALVLLLLSAYFVRSFGRDWDGFTHMHPDERMLMMVTEKISIPDKMYPDFFNYGSLPIYILKGFTQFIESKIGTSSLSFYGPGLLSSGRFLSTIFDIGTLLIIYLTIRFVGGEKHRSLALIAACIYAFSFFTIQNSHFFVVDVFVTFFLSAASLFMLLFLKKKRMLFLWLHAIFLGFSLASKFTAILFVPGSIITIFVYYLFSTKSQLPKKIGSFVLTIFVWGLIFCTSFTLAMPYAILPPSGILSNFGSNGLGSELRFSTQALDSTIKEFSLFFTKDSFPTIRFLRDMKEQTRMNSDPYVFPYTLQYAGTTPYIYYLYNIFVWGIGPFTSIFAFIAVFFLVRYATGKDLISHIKKQHIDSRAFTLHAGLFIFFSYFLFFVIIGKSAVKFMRYMLPLYPLIAVTCAYGVDRLIRYNPAKKFRLISNIAKISLVLLAVAWTMAFMSIYTEKNTRDQATEWILQNIPSGKTLGVEHWDDRVPTRYSERYKFVEIQMYDRPDDAQKWALMNEKLKSVDYYVIASNRLYAPLQRLTDCNLHGQSCYPIASKFYANLLSGKAKFKKIKEFTSYPRLGGIIIPDDEADESFTVYDHPKVIIFKR